MDTMENKKDMRGMFSPITKNWEEIRKSGGRCLDIETLADFLSRDNETMLTREEVMQRTLNYFNSCVEQVEDEETGKLVTTWVRNPTKTGYALSLGIDIQTLTNYINGTMPDKSYNAIHPNVNRIISSADFDILQRAYQVIMEFYESKLGNSANVVGAIYWLNNSSNTHFSNLQEFSFSDKASKNEKLIPTEQLPDLSRFINDNSNVTEVDTFTFPDLSGQDKD